MEHWEETFDSKFVKEVETGYKTSAIEVVGSPDAVKQFIREQLESVRLQSEHEQSEIYESLHDMWDQYCQPPYYHDFMSAGEHASVILERYKRFAKWKLDLPDF